MPGPATERAMTIEEACASILGPETAHAIILGQGIQWAVVAAMAAATTDDDPEALAAIDRHRAQKREERA